MFKYLFTALLKDGTLIEQTQEDKSTHTEGKNAFYDVLQRFDEVRAFAMQNQETQDEYVVDLEDGRFEVNGASFYLHENDMPLTNFRLIYFKRNIISISRQEILEPMYYFGFQANDSLGNNVKHLLSLR